MNTIKIRRQQTKMIAHRGLSGLERENSAAAFIAAGNRSYFGTECDIHLTLDNVFVVCHDDDLKRVSSSDLIIKNSLLTQIKQVELYEVKQTAGKDYLHVPTLQEYLEISKKYDKICIIEIKPELTTLQIKELLKQIKDFGYLEHVIFISFRFSNLEKLHQEDGSLKMQFLTSKISAEIINKCLAIKASIDINYQQLTKEVVDLIHSHQLEVNVWTIDDAILARKLVKWGVDYITTNILE
ncbi:MAG: glycerophosphodiester phosphodiesterase [Bacilli bacterium]